MKKQIFLFLSLSFLLNLLWEVSHSMLYQWNPTFAEYIPAILKASFIDFLILSAIFIAISLKNKNLAWINKPSKFNYILIVAATTIIAIFIEFEALQEGRWSYNQFMPTILGIGISPLIQLTLTMLLALWLARK